MDDDARLAAMLEVAKDQDPSIEAKPGTLILRACLQVLADEPSAQAPEVARRVLARYRHADASWTAHLATIAVGAQRRAERGAAVGARRVVGGASGDGASE